MGIGTEKHSEAEQHFREALGQIVAPRVLELGTLRSERDRPTHHAEWLPNISEFVMSDVEHGTDVDVVADAHDLVAVFGEHCFDAVIAVSVYEHLQRPWIATIEIGKILKPGGVLYCASHQSFPLHWYGAPSQDHQDGWRFSESCWRTMLWDAGIEPITTGYAYPCVIQPPASITRWNKAAPAYLNSDVYGRKLKTSI